MTPVSLCVVGSGPTFLSGISYYTHRLAEELSSAGHRVSVVRMRRLLPRRLYPGRARVGAPLAELRHAPEVAVLDGVDWYWWPSLLRARRFLDQQQPDVLLLQWWTGTVLHSYIALALLARRRGCRVVIEFHEVQDIGELGVPLAGRFVEALMPWLLRLTDGYVVHNDFDRALLMERYPLGDKPVALIPHGPYDAYRQEEEAAPRPADDVCHLLYFGVVRPFKGVEHLLEAFNALPPQTAQRYRLTVVGETWEGWTRPDELIAASPYRDLITRVDEYVPDERVADHFAAADVVVLPYQRSSSSGPLHIAMSCGLPVVVSRVGGLVEAASAYEGAVLVEPAQPDDLWRGVERAQQLRGRRYRDPHSWETTVTRLRDLFAAAGAPVSPSGPPARARRPAPE